MPIKKVYVVSRRFTMKSEPYFIWDKLVGVATTNDLASHMCAKDLARQNQEEVANEAARKEEAEKAKEKSREEREDRLEYRKLHKRFGGKE